MRLKSLLIAVFLLLAMPVFIWADGWPVKFRDLSDSSIHTEALTKLKEFSEKFAGDPSANEAVKLLKADSSNKNKNAWIDKILSFTTLVLKTHPPKEENKEIREAALLILDYPLHVDASSKGADPKLRMAWQEALTNYYKAGTTQAIKEIQSEKPGNGLIIWKMYNMGFVVKSKNHSIGFDIVSDMGRALDSKQIAALAKKLDILFISHAHGDHISFELIKTMAKAGKKIVMPASVGQALKLDEKNLVQLYDNSKQSTDMDGMKILSFPGKQDQLDCSVYVVSLDGFTVSHNGDNMRGEIYQEIARGSQIDVLLANCWSGMRGYIETTKPKMVISGHENELGHEVSHRESYLKTFNCLNGVKAGSHIFVMECGEQISYPLANAPKSENEAPKNRTEKSK